MKRATLKLACDDCNLVLEVDVADWQNAIRRIGWRHFPNDPSGERVVRCVACRLDLIEAAETVFREIERG